MQVMGHEKNSARTKSASHNGLATVRYKFSNAQASRDEGEYEKTTSLAGQGVGWV